VNRAAETIFALSSGPGRAAVGVIRLSGPKAAAALEALSGWPCPPPRRATLRRLADPESGETLDRALVLYLPAPYSFTGEDMVELQVHGGRAVITGVLEALSRQAGLRPAEPGAFSRRAFDHGRLGLVEAEALADLIEADTAVQRRQALRQLGGELGRLYDGWRAAVIACQAELEAELDFSDQDLPEGLAAAVEGRLRELVRSIAAHLSDQRRGERLRDGLEIAILGPPNAGKSSLLNVLAKREAAIVSALAGTTRDVVEVRLDLAGYPVILADTAGLRDSAEGVEQEGIRRALARAEQADLKLIVLDGETWPELVESVSKLIDSSAVVVLNKQDRLRPCAAEPRLADRAVLPISCLTGAGLGELLARLEQAAGRLLPASEAPPLTRLRHRVALRDALEALQRAAGAGAPELVAEDLRLAAGALGRITGRIDVEDVLDEVFRSFCIGK
jgi:tRNA modification GTPase